MHDAECVEFLQWALPRLRRRWPGFRKVRRRLCRRIDRRLRALGLSGPPAYREYLECTPAEWAALDALCPITVSSFCRDRAVFDFLAGALLPQLAQVAATRGERTVRAWSIGCASGEEPYSLMLAWRLGAPPSLPGGLALRVLATDVDEAVLARARAGCYAPSSLKQLPPNWLQEAFESADGLSCLRPRYREGVDFLRRDIRATLPEERFQLILCRNLIFTYFDEPTQREMLTRIASRLFPGGALVIGRRESLPPGAALNPWPGAERLGIYRWRLTDDRAGAPAT